MTGIIATLSTQSVFTPETHVITTGVAGLNPNRLRGYSVSNSIGACSPTTNGLGQPIDEMYYDESGGAPTYTLSIPGAANSGWTKIDIGSKTLLRSAATYFSAGIWRWNTSDTVATQAFGAGGSTPTVTIS